MTLKNRELIGNAIFLVKKYQIIVFFNIELRFILCRKGERRARILAQNCARSVNFVQLLHFSCPIEARFTE